MARFYQTSKPTDVDFVRKVPAEFLLLKAQQDAQVRSTAGLLTGVDEALDTQTFMPLTPIIQEFKNQVRGDIDKLTELSKKGVTPEYLSGITNVTRKISDFRGSGKGDQLGRSFQNYVARRDQLLKEPGMTEDRVAEYDMAINTLAKRYKQNYDLDPNAPFEDITNQAIAFPAFDQDKYLNDNIKPENNTQVFSNPIPVMEKGKPLVDSLGRPVMASSYGQLRNSGIRFKYRLDELTTEGYNKSDMEIGAYANLISNEAFVKDLKHRWTYRNLTDEQGNPYPKTDEGFNQYVQDVALRYAQNHVAKFNKEESKIKTSFVDDKDGLDASSQARARAYEKEKERVELQSNGIIEELKDGAKTTYTPKGLHENYSAAKIYFDNLQREYTELLRGKNVDLNKLETVRESLVVATKKMETLRDDRNNMFITTINTAKPGSELYNEVQRLKEKAKGEFEIFDYDYYLQHNKEQSTYKILGREVNIPLTIGGATGSTTIKTEEDAFPILEKALSESQQVDTYNQIYRFGTGGVDKLIAGSMTTNNVTSDDTQYATIAGGNLATDNKGSTLRVRDVVAQLNDPESNAKFSGIVQTSNGTLAEVTLGNGTKALIPYSSTAVSNTVRNVFNNAFTKNGIEPDENSKRLLFSFDIGPAIGFAEELALRTRQGNYQVGDLVTQMNKQGEGDPYGVKIKSIITTPKSKSDPIQLSETNLYLENRYGNIRVQNYTDGPHVIELMSDINHLRYNLESRNIKLNAGEARFVKGRRGFQYVVFRDSQSGAYDYTPVYDLPNEQSTQLLDPREYTTENHESIRLQEPNK